MPNIQQEQDRLMFELVLFHQLLLERFKLYQLTTFDPILRAAAKEVRMLIAELEYDTLREIPRREFNKFVKTLSNIEIFDQYIEEQKEMLEQLAYVEIETQRKIVEKVLEKQVRVNPETIWTTIRNEPLTASFLFGVLDDFKNRIKKLFTQIIHHNYVSGASVATLQKEIIGTRVRNYRDGLFSRLKKQSKSIVNTVVQHVSIMANEQISSTEYDKYEWSSMLDDATCEECDGLNGEIFNLGEGPRPPIHYNCRCIMIPIKSSIVVPSIDEWMEQQTPEFRRSLNKPLSLGEYEQQVEELLEKGVSYGS